MKELFAVAAGGLIGVLLRYFLINVILNKYEISFSGVLAVNLTGCLLIGITAAILEAYTGNYTWNLFIITGVLGGFTTFSSYSLECVNLLINHYYLRAITYLLLHNILGIALTFAGFILTKKMLLPV